MIYDKTGDVDHSIGRAKSTRALCAQCGLVQWTLGANKKQCHILVLRGIVWEGMGRMGGHISDSHVPVFQRHRRLAP